MADDDPLFAVRNESSGKWRWRWRSPWGSVHVSPTLHSSAKNAIDRWPQVAGGEHLMVWSDESDREWLTEEECARRLGCSLTRVRELVERNVLRARYNCYGGIGVECAVVTCWTG